MGEKEKRGSRQRERRKQVIDVFGWMHMDKRDGKAKQAGKQT